MESILIENGTLLDPARVFERRMDLLVRDGKIAAVGADLHKTPAGKSAQRRIDAAGCYVMPGFVDLHVHLREPGDEEEETIATGSAAAVAGGFTSVCCMPNTKPPLDNEGQIEFVLRQAEKVGLCRVYPSGAITKERQGKELAEIGSMLQRGAVAFTDDGCAVADDAVMRKALQYAKMFDALLMQHCEAPSLAGGCMHAGIVSLELGLAGIPPEAETLIISRDLLLNRAIGCRYHVQHLSCGTSVELIRQAKAQGQPVSAEATPHHLLLTDEACRNYDTNFKMNPPLRTEADLKEIIAGIKDGTIDCLATDHAPHLAEEKELEFPYAPFGILGMECALPLYIKALIEPGHIDWMRLADLVSTRPAAILKIPAGTLAEGAAADIAIVDPSRRWTIDPSRFKSKSRNCPFAGWEITGRVTHTLVGGKMQFELATEER